MNKEIDKEILESLRNGDHKAFKAIFVAYYNKTKAFIDGYIKSEPDLTDISNPNRMRKSWLRICLLIFGLIDGQ